MDLPIAPIRILSAADFGRDPAYLSVPRVRTRRHWYSTVHSTRPSQECANPRQMLLRRPQHRRGVSAPVPGLQVSARRGSAPIQSYARPESVDVADLILETGPNRNQTEQREVGYGASRQWSEKCQPFF